MGTKLYVALEQIKFWDHANYGDCMHDFYIGARDCQAYFSPKPFIAP